MNKRNEKRIDKSLLAYTDGNDADLLGVVTNISKNGTFIVTEKIFDIESEILFVMAGYNELYHLKGEIRWTRCLADQSLGHLPTGIGIRITDAPVEYLNFVELSKYENQNLASLTH